MGRQGAWWMFEKENLPPLYISDWLNLSLNIDRMTSPVGHPCDKSLSAGDAFSSSRISSPHDLSSLCRRR